MQKGTVSYKISNCGCWVLRGPTNMKPFFEHFCDAHTVAAVEPVAAEEPDASTTGEEAPASGTPEAGIEGAEATPPPEAETKVEGAEAPQPQGLSTYSEPKPPPDPLGLEI